jgi:hypothetical protein
MLDQLGGMIGAAVLVALIGLTGAPLVVRTRATWRLLDFATAAVVAGLCIATVAALALAYLGLFTVYALAATLLVLATGFWITTRRALSGFRLLRPDAAEILIVLFAAAFLVFGVAMRFNVLNALRDHGVYIASGIELARTQDFGWTDPLVSRHGIEAVRHLLINWGDFYSGNPTFERFAGFSITDESTGRVWPQFLHGYEVWIGVAYALAGPQAAQCVTVGFAALAILAVFCAVRQVFGSAALAVVSALLLGASPAQLWFARYPGNEPMIQALLWTVLLLYARGVSCVADADPRPRRPEVYLAVLVLASAMLTKVAAWGFGVVFAFEAGLRLARGELRASAPRVWIAVIASAAIAFLHARLFAHDYLFGMWTHTAKRFGVSYSLFGPLLVSLTAAAFSAGALAAPLFARLATRWQNRGFRAIALSTLVAVVYAMFLFQLRVHSRGQADVWSERTNLVELALYFSNAGFVIAVAGIALLAFRSSTAKAGLFLLFLIASAAFLLRRNLEAVHPWGARRWVPLLFPMVTVGIAVPAALLWERGRSVIARAGAAVVAIAAIAMTISAAPVLITARDNVPAVEHLDRLGSHLRADDLVLMQPTNDLAQWGAYLKAHMDVHAYILPSGEEGWHATLPIARAAAADGNRILYLTDDPITAPQAIAGGVRLVYSTVFEYQAVYDGIHALPSGVDVERDRVLVYELLPDALTDSWWPTWTPGKRRDPAALPLTFRLDEDAPPYIRNFYDVTPLADGSGYRWSNGLGEILMGELLQHPLPVGILKFTVRAASGRPGEPVGLDWMLDMHDPQRARQFGSSPVTTDFAEYTAELDSSLVHPDSVLRLESWTPRVGKHPPGQLGCAIEWLRIEMK